MFCHFKNNIDWKYFKVWISKVIWCVIHDSDYIFLLESDMSQVRIDLPKVRFKSKTDNFVCASPQFQ